MKFLVCEKQRGEGCDYSIGCGMSYRFIEARDLFHAMEIVVWPDGRNNPSTCDPARETCREDILIVPAEHVVQLDCDTVAASLPVPDGGHL